MEEVIDAEENGFVASQEFVGKYRHGMNKVLGVSEVN